MRRVAGGGSAGGGEGIDLARAETGLGEGSLDEGAQLEGVIARSNFRNDASVSAMEIDLGRDQGGEEFRSSALARIAHNRDRGFIATRLEGQE
mgnify:CR=1 FL=1